MNSGRTKLIFILLFCSNIIIGAVALWVTKTGVDDLSKQQASYELMLMDSRKQLQQAWDVQDHLRARFEKEQAMNEWIETVLADCYNWTSYRPTTAAGLYEYDALYRSTIHSILTATGYMDADKARIAWNNNSVKSK